MKHLVYKISNKTTLHYYIGVHSTENEDDGYMGSGTLIRRAIKEFGVGCFEKTILHTFETRKEALSKEKEIVNNKLLKDELCYNLVIGGGGLPEITPKTPKLQRLVKQTRFNENVYYKFELISNFTIQCADKLVEAVYMAIPPAKMMEMVTNTYNYKETHDCTDKFVKILNTKIGYSNNIICREVSWQKK